MKFTILVPVYNRSGYIAATLESVLSQSYTDFELICVDDGSTDESAALLQEYARKDNRIRILTHNENKGLYLARKTGVLHASGNYVLFLDCDDVLEPHALTELYRELCTNPVEVLEFGYRCVCTHECVLPPSEITQDNLFHELVYARHPRAGTVWNKAYNARFLKDAFARMSNFYAVMGEDFYESVIIAYYTRTYAQLHEVIVLYNDESGVSHAEKTIANITKDVCSLSNAVNGLKAFFDSYAVEHKTALVNIERHYIHFVYYNLILLKMHTKDRYAAVELLKTVFSDEAVSIIAYKTKWMIACDAVFYKVRSVIKNCIPHTMREKIKRMRRFC